MKSNTTNLLRILFGLALGIVLTSGVTNAQTSPPPNSNSAKAVDAKDAKTPVKTDDKKKTDEEAKAKTATAAPPSTAPEVSTFDGTYSGVLTLRGEKQTERKEGDESRYHIVERSYGSFVRSFQLPQGLDESKIEASYNNGILSIHIPKSALAQPKKIQIKSGQASGNRQIEGVGTSGSSRRTSTGDNMNQQQQQPMAASGSSNGGKNSSSSRRETGAKS